MVEYALLRTDCFLFGNANVSKKNTIAFVGELLSGGKVNFLEHKCLIINGLRVLKVSEKVDKWGARSLQNEVKNASNGVAFRLPASLSGCVFRGACKDFVLYLEFGAKESGEKVKNTDKKPLKSPVFRACNSRNVFFLHTRPFCPFWQLVDNEWFSDFVDFS